MRDNHRIGLVGPNGAGKTTLLRVISGETEPDLGSVQQGSTTLGYLKQEVEESPGHRPVIEEAMDAFAEVRRLHEEEDRILIDLGNEADHESKRYSKLLEDLDRVHMALHAGEAHRARPRAEAVLSGLGFEADAMDQPLGTFSGGWRMRVALAKLLLKQPDVILLDEPTNHLDIDSIDWLENYLKAYPGTVVIVSHDRYFLDRMVDRIAEMSRGRLTEYAGNYSFYLEARIERRAIQKSAFDNQQKSIADTERFIERFRAKATKATQVQSRVKLLDKLERVVEPEQDEAGIRFRFPEPKRSGRSVIEVSRFSKVYDGEERRVEVFRDAGPLHIERGDKIALIGRNGAGKSTLARMLAGVEPFEGDLRLGKDVELTFFAQHTADSLNPSETVLESVQRVAYGQSETEVRSLLGAFLFSGDDVFKPVKVLSGGEKSRVALARTLVVPANFLLLDEPTNHLDIRSIGVLIEALKQYTGTFALVSHDRHFLDQVVTTVWRVEDGGVHDYPGTYSEYQWKTRETATPTPRAAASTRSPATPVVPVAVPTVASTLAPTKPAAAATKPAAAPKGADAEWRSLNDFKLKKIYRDVESQILEEEERKSTVEASLGDPKLYGNEKKSRDMTARYEASVARLQELYEKWERVSEVLTERGISVFLVLWLALAALATPSQAQIYRLPPPDTAAGNYFGTDVAVSGDRILVGATGIHRCGPNSGAAYVYARSEPGEWALESELVASDCAEEDFFGRAVAISGEVAAVTAYRPYFSSFRSNAVVVFERNADGSWKEVSRLEAPGGAREGAFAASLSLDGYRLVVTSAGDTGGVGDPGAAYVYERTAQGEWVRTARVEGSGPASRGIFGTSCAVSGDWLAVSASTYGRQTPGTLFLFHRSADGSWRERQAIHGIDDYFIPLEMDQHRLVVGERRGGHGEDGQVSVFARTVDGSWSEEARLSPPDPYPSGGFGSAVALSGSRALIVGFDEQLQFDFNIDRIVYAFQADSTGQWAESQVLDVGHRFFGAAIDLDGTTAVIGDVSDAAPGEVYVARLR